MKRLLLLALVGTAASAAPIDMAMFDQYDANHDGYVDLIEVRGSVELQGRFNDIDVDIPPALRDRYFAALDAAKAAEEEKRAASGLVLDLIGAGRRAVVGPHRVATRTVRDGKTYSLQPARSRGNA